MYPESAKRRSGTAKLGNLHLRAGGEHQPLYAKTEEAQRSGDHRQNRRVSLGANRPPGSPLDSNGRYTSSPLATKLAGAARTIQNYGRFQSLAGLLTRGIIVARDMQAASELWIEREVTACASSEQRSKAQVVTNWPAI
jgi:hypothetical protein